LIPTHNRPQMLQEAGDGAFAQSFSDVETIIVLTVAPPDSVGMAIGFHGDPRLQIVELQHAALATSRTLGRRVAARYWLARGDESWRPHMPEVQLESAHETGAHLVCCNFCYVNQDGIIEQRALRPMQSGLSFAAALMVGNYVSGGSGGMVKAAKIRGLGGFDA